MKLYHLSDLHLGASAPSFSAGKRDALVLKKLKEILRKAENEGVFAIILAGDIFDSNAVLTTLARSFFEILCEFPELCFVLIPGGGSFHQGEISGHDAFGPDSVYLRPEIKPYLEAQHINLLTPDNSATLIDFSGKKIGFYAGFFAFPDVSLFPSADYHVAIMHGAFGPNQAYETPLPQEVLSSFDYLALGHYHGFKKLAENAFYSGAFVQFEYLPGEKALSGYLEVSLAPKGLLVERKVLEGAPSFLRLRIMSENDLDKIKNLDFEHTFLRVESYLENFKEELAALCKHFPGHIQIAEGAEIPKADLIFYQTFEKLLDEVPDELQDEVREFVLYGLLVSQKPSTLKSFLEEKYLK
ncbi:metallophosphoesterase family protein [Thermodesulfatator atlanticus]